MNVLPEPSLHFVSGASPARIDQAVDALSKFLAPRTGSIPSSHERVLSHMQAWLTNDLRMGVTDQTMAVVLSTLLGLAHDATCDHLGAFAAPLLLWSVRQPWGQEVQHPRVFSSLCNQHYVRFSRLQPDQTCNAALSHILAWHDKFPIALQRALAAHALQDVNIKMDWRQRRTGMPSVRAQEWSICAKLAHLVCAYPNHRCSKKSTLLDHWTLGMTQYADAMNVTDQIEWARMTLDSDMPSDYKIRGCHLLSPDVWLDSVVQKSLDPLLPTNEFERFRFLPWAEPGDRAWPPNGHDATPARMNQNLLRVYCPVSERLLDCVVTSSDWETKRAIAAVMAQMEHPSDACVQYSLPDNLDMP